MAKYRAALKTPASQHHAIAWTHTDITKFKIVAL